MNYSDKKILVFKFDNQTNDSTENKVYVDNDKKPIKPENIIKIEVPYETYKSFSLNPIVLDKKFYYEFEDISNDASILLLNYVFELAKNNEYSIQVWNWEGSYEREEGLPSIYDLYEYLEYDEEEEEESIGEIAFYGISDIYGKYGCAEIVLVKDDETIPLYHSERTDEYVLNWLFDFIEKYCK